MACDGDHETRVISFKETEALKIVTLSPHLGEMVYDLGAEHMLVGVSAYSNHPKAILQLPQIGDAFMLDLERIALLRPDIILAWEDGTPVRIIDELRNFGYRVEVVKSNHLKDIPLAYIFLGEILGKQEQAKIIANTYLKDLMKLKEGYETKDSIRVFFQIDERPLFTVGGSHYISELIQVCGGINIFTDLPQLAPSVSIESVIIRDPEVILTTTSDPDKNKFELWVRWPGIRANQLQNLYTINADRLERSTSNLIKAGQEICQKLEQSRMKRFEDIKSI
jgi:iron complex transport system substrate-binding protein